MKVTYDGNDYQTCSLDEAQKQLKGKIGRLAIIETTKPTSTQPGQYIVVPAKWQEKGVSTCSQMT